MVDALDASAVVLQHVEEVFGLSTTTSRSSAAAAVGRTTGHLRLGRPRWSTL